MLRISALVGLSLVVVACQGDSIAPEQDTAVLTTGFEAGLDGWTMRSSDPADATVSLDTAEGLAGQCAMLAHNNRIGAFYQWIEREVSADRVGNSVTVEWVAGNVGSRSLLKSPIIAVRLAEGGELSEADFRVLGLIGDPNGIDLPVPLSEHFPFTVHGGTTLRIGVGFLTGWEVQQSLCLDDIVVRVIP
jgi:hypothetical protein